MHLLSRPRRARRPREWSPDKAVTFIVTLAASRSVTFAARAAGMSRKSAYALKERDRAFAAAWVAALRAGEGDKAGKVARPAPSMPQSDTPLSSRPSADPRSARLLAERERDLFFARLAGASGMKPPHGMR